MPQVDLIYSDSLDLSVEKIGQAIDESIQKADGPGRDCKIRITPAPYSNKPNIFLTIGLLQKPHRDEAFQTNLIDLLFTNLTPYLPKGTAVSINIYWLNKTYTAKTI